MTTVKGKRGEFGRKGRMFREWGRSSAQQLDNGVFVHSDDTS